MCDPDEPARFFLLKISARETVNPAYFAAMKIPVILLLLTGTVYAQKAPDYTLHEWGTFTTVSGSDGGLLPGLQREEEGLPAFVHSHAGMENLGDVSGNPDGTVSIKGWIRPLKNVTVKMETPVIYFYTKEPFQAKVAVGFSGGSISQWYPARSGGETPPEYVPQESVGTAKIAGFQIGGAISGARCACVRKIDCGRSVETRSQRKLAPPRLCRADEGFDGGGPFPKGSGCDAANMVEELF